MIALFAVVSIAVVDDFGVSTDEFEQREIAQMNIDYALGNGDLPSNHNRYYGVAFEAPLVLVERLLGLTDSRAILLSRHLLTHLFFLAGGWFCYLFIYRLFDDRYLALFALLLFLLHPRMYAHSFFNSKDLPFLAAFMIALYLAQRAFRRDTAATFAACGVGVSVLINLRVMGAVLFAAVIGLRALDLLLARNRPERRRMLATTAAFVLAAAGTLYALSPYLWRDPLAVADAFIRLARHPVTAAGFFQGQWVRWPSIPPHYLPTWMAISTPPATLLLCLIGAGAAIARGVARPGSLLRNTPLRFEWLLLACLTLPVAAVIALNSNIYDGWRQMYFLYAPLCLLAVCGLRALLAAARRLRSGAATARLRRGLSALAAAALVTTAADAVRLHPNQDGYFNFLVDRRTPGHLGRRWHLPYWSTQYRQALEYLLARFPDSTLYVDGTKTWRMSLNRAILPAAARRRILFTGRHFDEAPGQQASFYVNLRQQDEGPLGLAVYTLRVYHSTVLEVRRLPAPRDPAVDQRAAVCAVGPALPVYRNPYPNVECHPNNPLLLPRPVGLRLEGCSFDVKNNLLYVIQHFSDRAFAYRDGIYVGAYDAPFPDRSVTGLRAPRWHGATFLPAKYDHAMLLLANRDGSVWGFSDLSQDRIARGESGRIRAAKYDLGGAQIAADLRTGQFAAQGITYDAVRDRLYLSSGGNAAAFMRNPRNTAWVRDAASDVAGAGGAGLTFDGLSLLSAAKSGVSAWTEGAASPNVSIPPEALQRLAGNILVRGLAWDGSNLYLCDRNNNTVWTVPAPRQ